MSKFILLFFSLTILLTLSACGGDDSPAPPSPADFLVPAVGADEDNDNETTAVPSAPRTDGGTIRVLAPTHFSAIINRAAELMKAEWDIVLDLTSFNPESPTGGALTWANDLQILMENGDGFDIIFSDPRFPMYEFIRQGFLADINDLMASSRNTNINDLYTQPLHALSVDGGLYFFPLNFGFQFISLNDNVPENIRNRFANMEHITLNQMMDIFIEIFSIEYWFENYGWFRFATCRDMVVPGFAVANAMVNFVDLDNGVSNLDSPDFVEVLERINATFESYLNITYNWFAVEDVRALSHIRYNSTGFGSDMLRWFDAQYLHTPTIQELTADQYVFSVLNEFRTPLSGHIPFHREYNPENLLNTNFSHFVPLVDEQGRLVTNMGLTYPWNLVSFGNTANAQLAWEFASRFLVEASVCRNTTSEAVPITSLWWARPNLGHYSFDSPILRQLTREHLTQTIDFVSTTTSWGELTLFLNADGEVDSNYRTVWRGIPFEGLYQTDDTQRNETINGIIERVEMLNNMPMSPLPLIPIDLFDHFVLEMLRQNITPQAAAISIHNVVEDWLNGL